MTIGSGVQIFSWLIVCGKIKTILLPAAKNRLTIFNYSTNGILPLRMRKLTMEELGRKTAGELKQAPKNPFIVVLDNIRSMHNVGSVFRTADAFLAEEILLCGYTPRPPHRDIQKTALGATESVRWNYFATVGEALQYVKGKGYKVFAIEQAEPGISLENFDEKGGVALVFGNEVEGVSEAALAYCDGCVEIPQSGMKHSLNISVAAGIVLWKLFEKKLQEAGK
jgi:23S rRNA (guanosine2251-2'-O)-methyltransferase